MTQRVRYECDGPGCSKGVMGATGGTIGGLTMRFAPFTHGDHLDLADARIMHFCTRECFARLAAAMYAEVLDRGQR